MPDVCIIRYLRNIKIIDEKTKWSNTELHDTTQWCCKRLPTNGEIGLSEDGKFGFPIYDYVCGDMEYKDTDEIDYCPYCGKPVAVIELDPIIRKGKTVYDTVERTVKIKKNKRIEWEDGEVEKDEHFISSTPVPMK